MTARPPTPSRASIIDGSVEVERGRAQQATFQRVPGRSLKGGRSLSSFATFIPMARPCPVAAWTPDGPDNRPEAFSRAPCTRCGARGTFGCRHQKPYRED